MWNSLKIEIKIRAYRQGTFCLIDCRRTAFASIICQNVLAAFPFTIMLLRRKTSQKRKAMAIPRNALILRRVATESPGKRCACVYVHDPRAHLTLLAVARCRRRRTSPRLQICGSDGRPGYPPSTVHLLGRVLKTHWRVSVCVAVTHIFFQPLSYL